jgi:hypothetical protein
MRCLQTTQACSVSVSVDLSGALHVHMQLQCSDLLIFTVDNLISESYTFSVCMLLLTAPSQWSLLPNSFLDQHPHTLSFYECPALVQAR